MCDRTKLMRAIKKVEWSSGAYRLNHLRYVIMYMISLTQCFYAFKVPSIRNGDYHRHRIVTRLHSQGKPFLGVTTSLPSPDYAAGNASSSVPFTAFKRRVRYTGSYPKRFQEKYKELRGDEETLRKVREKGGTPAGQHVPIMVEQVLELFDIPSKYKSNSFSGELAVVDCTCGYGGHSLRILDQMINVTLEAERQSSSSSKLMRLIAIDQDAIELSKTEIRINQFLSSSFNESQSTALKPKVNFYNTNFQKLESILTDNSELHHLQGRVTALLADLGVSSMQIDNPTRGFTFKDSGPLDMRMNISDPTIPTAYELLSKLRVHELQAILEENSDETLARPVAESLLSGGAPKTTDELVKRVHSTVKANKHLIPDGQVTKKLLDSTVARTMQAIRIEVNGEFKVLERLLESLPKLLQPGGIAVFLTFHSGEDRRVKKSFKNGFQNGIYSSWSRDVVRASFDEKRDNPRSKCCKLRWCIKS